MSFSTIPEEVSSPSTTAKPEILFDPELGKLASVCAGLLEVPRVLVVETPVGNRYRVGSFPGGDGSESPVPSGLQPRNIERILQGATAGAPLVEPIATSTGLVAGALILPETAGLEPPRPTGLDAARALLSAALEARWLRARNVKVEQELWRSERRMKELSETVATGIALVDTKGIIIEINSVAASILGEDPDKIIGSEFRRFVWAEDLGPALEEFGMRLGGDVKRRETEMQIVRPSGERRLLRIRSSTLLDEVGVAGVYFAARDITDEHAREAQLRRAERFANIAPLLGGVCHELNNPLTSIKSFAELMLMDERPEEDREALEIVKREASRAARIVTDLRLVARQTQEDGAQATNLDINELVQRGIETVRAECEQSSVELRLELGTGLKRVRGVQNQLERVVEQLFANAVDALRTVERERRYISVHTYETERGVGLRVADNGPGIKPGDEDRIFDPFWTTRATGEGTGLGLSLVHGIVAEHDGQIRVEGGWGTGAVFTIDFPAADELATGREPAVQAPARTSLRILIVDDEAPIRYSLGRYMTRRGHSVSEAEEGSRALALLAGDNGPSFDIIVADLRMPGLGGDQLYTRLKARGDGMEERLIFITGDAESPDMAHILAEAGAPVVLKPFELAEIAQIIETQAGTLTQEAHPQGA